MINKTILIAFLISLGGLYPRSEAKTKHIYVTLSIFWEGSHLHEHNIKTIETLRETHPEIKVHHFISPAYFLHENREERIATIKRAIRPKDTLGVFVSPWKNLIQEADILFRVSPSFWGPRETACESNCGNAVPLTVYSSQDIKKIFDLSRNIIERAGFKPLKSYSVSGWQHSTQIANAAKDTGFHYDFSAIPPSRIHRRLHNYPVYNWTLANLSGFEGALQPKFSRRSGSPIIVIPQSGGIIDYNTVEELEGFFMEALKQSSESTIYNLALHQETISTFKPRLQRILSKINKLAEESGTTLTFDWASYRNKIHPN